jgi:hypothetical protein
VQVDSDTFGGLQETPLPLQPQGETIALAPADGALLVGSEGKRSRVQQVEVPELPTVLPDESGPTPSTSSSTTPSGETTAPSASPPSAPTAGEGVSPRVDRSEMWDGLGALLGLVLLAAVVVRLVGRRPR